MKEIKEIDFVIVVACSFASKVNHFIQNVLSV